MEKKYQDSFLASRGVLLGAFYALLSWVVISNISLLKNLFQFWWDSGTYGYGLLVIPISIYLIWNKRSQLSQLPINPSILGFLFLLTMSVGWWLSTLTDIQIAQNINLFGMIVGLVWSLLGSRVVRVLLFPLLYLFLALPMWWWLEPILQYMTVQVVMVMLDWFSVPAYVEGNFITIPSGQFHVEDVCAGLRFVLAASAITLLYGHLYLSQLWKQVVFFCVSVILAIVLNWLRVFIVIMAGHLTDMQHWLVHSHVGFGWVLFAVALIPVFWIGGKIRDFQYSGKYLNKMSIRDIPENKGLSNKIQLMVLPSTLLVLVIAPLSIYLLNSSGDVANNAEILVDNLSNTWTGPLEIQTDWRPVFHGADAELLQTYLYKEKEVSVYAAFYQTQAQGKELINELNKIYDPHVWSVQGQKKKQVTLAGLDQPLSINETIIRSANEKKRVIWYCYLIGDKFTSSPLMAKLLYVQDLISGNKGSAIIAISADYPEYLQYKMNLDEFMHSVVSIMQQIRFKK